MKRRLTTVVLLLSVLSASFAQMEQHISWKFSTKLLADNKVEVICEADVDEGWHVYSSVLPENTAIPTSIEIEENDAYTILDGITEKPLATTYFDKTFDAELSWFEGKATFSRVVQLQTEGDVVIKGYVESMICDDETCMPPEMVDFELKVTRDAPMDETAENSYWMLFWLSFGAGLIALLTPCVFPMIPMTVSFFTKQSKTKAQGIRNAVVYGLSIISIYVILGFAVAAIFGAEALNEMSTSPWFNLFFFLLLVVFAISFFGAFEIVIPSSWVNFSTKNEERGGFLGIFFMAFTLALVSFSCTGPIVGGLLVNAATGSFMEPIVGMLGFSSALALPFAFFAAFPGYLNSLPKSGGWLNSVKVVLGFLELAFAFKFLSNTDMVLDLHLLEREVFIAIWIAIFGALGFYLLGKIKLPHDSPMDYLPVPRLMLGLMVLAFTIYMVPGLWGAPLKLISAFPPGSDYAESPNGVGYVGHSSGGGQAIKLEKGMHPGPQGIPAFEDYEEAVKYAKKVNKPLMVDFTGKACVNCREMEANVWSDPMVKEMLTNDYVLVSLYVDLRTKLDEPFVSEATGKKIRTVGQKWADFQFTRFKQQGQPYYVLLDTDEKEINKPRAYDRDIEAYQDWLKEGITNFKK